MDTRNEKQKYLEDNMDMIFGTECINGSFSIELRNKLENIIIVKDVVESTHILYEKNNE